MVNSMLSYSSLSEGFWGEAMLMACYLLNRVPNKRNKTNPYELWFFVIKPKDFVSINSIIESRDAIFDENRFSSIPRPKDIIRNSDESQRDDHSNDVPSETPEPRREAIDDEIGSIMENNTWVLSDLPPGFRQKEGIDYFDTYALVARITTIKLLLALAAIYNLVIHQMDVKTAFLNGDLEEVYMKQPEGFVMPGNEHKVCKLVKSLYGLKQAPKQWHQKFDEVVLSSGFLLNQSDNCVYRKFDDSGEADVILGIKIKRENKEIVITQSRYIEKILKKFNREDFIPMSTPMDLVEKLKPNTGKTVDQFEYSRAIGCLMYAMPSTRADIVYAVGRLRRFTSNPSRQY
ncbi:zinc finger, CCHC-type containing protein [Tanacetum coccineum]